MSEPFWTKCRNCGKQVKLDGSDPDEKCYFCEKPAFRKEGSMVAQIKTPDLRPEAEIKPCIDKIIIKGQLLPVPKKPDTSGMDNFYSKRVLHKYYEDNATAIIADFQKLGPKGTRKRWGFSDYGFAKFRERHNLPKDRRKPVASQPAGVTGNKAAPTVAAVGNKHQRGKGRVFKPGKLCENCELAIEYRGYRQAIRDLGGFKNAD